MLARLEPGHLNTISPWALLSVNSLDSLLILWEIRKKEWRYSLLMILYSPFSNGGSFMSYFLFCSVCICLENQERKWEFPVITALVWDFFPLYHHFIYLIITDFREKKVPRKLKTRNILTFIKTVI